MLTICGSPRWKSNIILVHILTILLHSKCCGAELPLWAGLIRATRLIRESCIFAACKSPTFNRSFALQRFECSIEVELRNRIMFDFYPGLPHNCTNLPIMLSLYLGVYFRLSYHINHLMYTHTR